MENISARKAEIRQRFSEIIEERCALDKTMTEELQCIAYMGSDECALRNGVTLHYLELRREHMTIVAEINRLNRPVFNWRNSN